MQFFEALIRTLCGQGKCRTVGDLDKSSAKIFCMVHFNESKTFILKDLLVADFTQLCDDDHWLVYSQKR